MREILGTVKINIVPFWGTYRADFLQRSANLGAGLAEEILDVFVPRSGEIGGFRPPQFLDVFVPRTDVFVPRNGCFCPPDGCFCPPQPFYLFDYKCKNMPEHLNI